MSKKLKKAPIPNLASRLNGYVEGMAPSVQGDSRYVTQLPNRKEISAFSASPVAENIGQERSDGPPSPDRGTILPLTSIVVNQEGETG